MKKGGAAAFLLFCLSAILIGQKDQKIIIPPEQHSVEVRLVLVDVIVTRDGQFVRDLAEDDFEVYEDGRKVTLTSCELWSHEKELRRDLLREPVEKKEKAPPISPKKIAVIFDCINTWERNLKRGIDVIAEDLSSLADTGNEVSIYQLSEEAGLVLLQPFTPDGDLVRIAALRASGNAWNPDRLRFTTLESIERSVLKEIIELELKDYLLREKRRFENTMGGILAGINLLKGFPGRKAVLIISSGIPDITHSIEALNMGTENPFDNFLNPREILARIKIFDPCGVLQKRQFENGDQLLREVIRFANTQNVSVYTLDPDVFTKTVLPGETAEYAGRMEEEMASERISREGKLRKVQNLRALSEETGGDLFRGADKYQRFQEVLKTDLSYYYLLSYTPPRQKPDGAYHEIKVVVRRSGVSVRARQGYVDYTEKEEKSMFLSGAIYNPSLYADLSFEARMVPFYSESGDVEPWLSLAVPFRTIARESMGESGVKELTLYLLGVARGGMQRSFSAETSLTIKEVSSADKVIDPESYYFYFFKLSPQKMTDEGYEVSCVLYDPETKRASSVRTSLRFPEKRKDGGREFVNCVLGEGKGNGSEKKGRFRLNDQDGSLDYGGIKFLPRITHRFYRNEGLFVFMQVYSLGGQKDLLPEFELKDGEGSFHSLEGKPVAEHLDAKHRIWSALFSFDLGQCSAGDGVLTVFLPDARSQTGSSREFRIYILNPL
jgi:VWFA-related protein